jgi:hypothetical protein
MMFDIKQPFQSFDYCLREMKKKRQSTNVERWLNDVDALGILTSFFDGS